MYWDIGKILCYQRNFNFINGERDIGKTYTTLKYFLKRAIEHDEQFVYLVRTKTEVDNGILQKAFEKVVVREFKEYDIGFNCDEVFLEENSKRVLGYALAISMAIKIKKRSFPRVKWLVMDEYMLEENQNQRYIGGWKEPDAVLSIYHTIDREEDRVVCFFLGNNTSFYNPYHLHKAFNIPKIEKGRIWTNKYVLFQWAEADGELEEKKSRCKFVQMIADTQYGGYAVKGEYLNDSEVFIEERPATSRMMFFVEYCGEVYGAWYKDGLYYLSNKTDPSVKTRYALDYDDHNENTVLFKLKNEFLFAHFSKCYKKGDVRFDDAVIKKKLEMGIRRVL